MTPAYAAPEQLRGQPSGAFTDVYALGVILYELLAGRPPFDFSGRAPAEAEALILQREPDPPSRDAELNVLCLTAMHKDAERRYASVEALVRDIDHYLAGEPLEARPDTLGYRASKFVRRNRRAVAAAALLAAGVAALVAFYTVRLTAARNTALAEAARTQRVLRFTMSLFNGGAKEAGPAKDLRVAALLDRGLAEAARLDRDPVVQTELYETLGVVYQQLGDFNRADELLQSALNRRRAAPDRNQAKAVESIIKLALLRVDQAKLDEAERLAAEALAIVRRTLPPDHPTVAAATHAWGRVLEERGSYDRALESLQEAVRLRSAPGADPADLAESLVELASSHFYAGHYPESEAINRRLLDMHRQLYGDRHPLIAEDLVNLGAIQQELGNYAKAEEFHRQALEITQAFYGTDHYRTASGLTLIARAVSKQDRYDEAQQLLDRAVAIQEKVFGSVHPRVASALNEVANVALMKDRYDEAEAAFRRMVDVYRAVHSGKHYTIGIGLANLGSVYMARRQEPAAEALFREALAMYAQTLPPEHLNVAITKVKLGRVLLRQNRFVEAENETLAGYEVLSRQANPAVTFLRAARQDLAAIYTSLKQPERAKVFQAELAALAKK
jgi:serine/threonine-protein kinase